MPPLIDSDRNGGPEVAIVDVGIGNLFSVGQACAHAGIRGTITASRDVILNADAVLLPGMGSFGDAMASLQRHDLVEPLKDVAASGKHLVGICLGMQLLLSESSEFGNHAGLGILPGTVVRFEPLKEPDGARLKVPLVGWNRISRPSGSTGASRWSESPLRPLESGVYMYFVHSYYACPEYSEQVLCSSRYGDLSFCSGLMSGNVIGFQFHPERSGPEGLRIYQELRSMISARRRLGPEPR